MSTFTVQTFGRGRRRWVELCRVSHEADTGRAFCIALARIHYQLHSGWQDIEARLGSPENDATVIVLPYVEVTAWYAKELNGVSVPITRELYDHVAYPHAWAAQVSLALEARLSKLDGVTA